MSLLHPFIVHFPVALLTMSAVFEVYSVLAKKNELSRVGWWMQLSGTVGLMAAILSGLLSKSVTQVPDGVRVYFEAHEQLAFVNGTMFAALLLWRIGAKTRLPGEHRVAYLVVLVVAVGTLLTGAWYGGELVFRFGVGGPAGR